MDHLDNLETYKIIQAIDKDLNKFLGSICVSTRILANAGILNGRSVTGWDADNNLTDILKKAGATYVHSGVVVDNNLITATGPATAKDFAQAIVKALKQPQVQESV